MGLELEIGHIVELPVRGFPLHREWHLIHATDKRLGPLDQSFIAFVAEGRWMASIGRPLSTN